MRTKTPKQAEKMLDAAARLFGGQRFHEVRMEDIAAAASVGKGTLYRYFADKDELYLALLSRASAQFHDRARAAFDAAKGTRAKLTALVNAGLTFFSEQPHVGPMIQMAEVRRGAQSPWQPTRDAVTQWVTELLREATAAGELRTRDPHRAALMLLGGVRSVILFGRRPFPEGLADEIIAEFLGGLSA
jgi:AcrR family transcriptional regulator